MKQTTGAQGAWAGKEETTAHLTQKELDCPGARITQHLRARHDRREAGSTQAHPGDTQKYKNSVGARVGARRDRPGKNAGVFKTWFSRHPSVLHADVGHMERRERRSLPQFLEAWRSGSLGAASPQASLLGCAGFCAPPPRGGPCSPRAPQPPAPPAPNVQLAKGSVGPAGCCILGPSTSCQLGSQLDFQIVGSRLGSRLSFQCDCLLGSTSPRFQSMWPLQSVQSATSCVLGPP